MSPAIVEAETSRGAALVWNDGKHPSTLRPFAGYSLCEHCWNYRHAMCSTETCHCPCALRRINQFAAIVDSLEAFYQEAGDVTPALGDLVEGLSNQLALMRKACGL